ncbi:type IV secretion system DotC family protein [Candidatus Synchoanobacter obligatus]|uniref:Type IV secretion system DotC family protein n=1 Tax=Candidatus Synchoanobacter obligatus TaxID=2919597 RepID=A0ABT1L5A9_9GAMM|nr:type IV secretion system DotC family protein [Candidatus Synchoanobacter obligatus]MCP8352362.1 type IV secretion system DotC family protein [Candidatus Synchoanobacter obligatus]
MLRTIRYILPASIALVLLTGCDPTPDDGDSGHQKAMKEVALSYGAQAGLNWKSQQVATYLDSHSKYLDQVFDFNALLMVHNILPPIVAEYGKSYSLENDQTIRLSDQEIKMLEPARFVTVPPSWRDYIYLVYSKPQTPPESLLPHNEIEEQIWKDALATGWEIGIEQADAIFSDALARLLRDFKGIVLYHQLHLQNMISAPYAETTNLGVTGNTQGLRLNDKIIKIVTPSVLNPQTNQWHPILYNANE